MQLLEPVAAISAHLRVIQGISANFSHIADCYDGYLLPATTLDTSVMDMTYTIKALEKHSAVVTALLDASKCDYTFTGTVIEDCGTQTHNWFISRPGREDAIGIEDELQSLPIPYSTTHHGPHFLPYKHCNFRLDDTGKPQLLEFENGDNTLDLLNELENAIAGNDYAFVRNFISKKRSQYLLSLNWASQVTFSNEFDFA